MPSNAETRRVKDKKKKDKKKKTDPTPLSKEDKASVDSPSLSLASKDKASADSSSSLSLTGIGELSEVERLEREILGAKILLVSHTKRKIRKDSTSAKRKPWSIRRGNQNSLPCPHFG